MTKSKTKTRDEVLDVVRQALLDLEKGATPQTVAKLLSSVLPETGKYLPKAMEAGRKFCDEFSTPSTTFAAEEIAAVWMIGYHTGRIAEKRGDAAVSSDRDDAEDKKPITVAELEAEREYRNQAEDHVRSLIALVNKIRVLIDTRTVGKTSLPVGTRQALDAIWEWEKAGMLTAPTCLRVAPVMTELLARKLIEMQNKRKGGLSGQAMTQWSCIRCGQTAVHGNTAVPLICEICVDVVKAVARG